MCSARETYLVYYFPSLGLRVTRGFGQEVSIFFSSEISIRCFIGLEREVTMVCFHPKWDYRHILGLFWTVAVV